MLNLRFHVCMQHTGGSDEPPEGADRASVPHARTRTTGGGGGDDTANKKKQVASLYLITIVQLEKRVDICTPAGTAKNAHDPLIHLDHDGHICLARGALRTSDGHAHGLRRQGCGTQADALRAHALVIFCITSAA